MYPSQTLLRRPLFNPQPVGLMILLVLNFLLTLAVIAAVVVSIDLKNVWNKGVDVVGKVGYLHTMGIVAAVVIGLNFLGWLGAVFAGGAGFYQRTFAQWMLLLLNFVLTVLVIVDVVYMIQLKGEWEAGKDVQGKVDFIGNMGIALAVLIGLNFMAWVVSVLES